MQEQTSLPFAGRTVPARHASYTGALVASARRGRLTLEYLALLDRVGPLSDPQAAKMLGCGVSSMCSIRAGLGEAVQPSGQFEVHVWPSGQKSKRVKWRRVR